MEAMNLYILITIKIRYFVRQSIKGGRCAASNQFYKSTVSDEVFNNISKEFNVIGKISEILDEYFEFENKLRKIIQNEYGSQFKDYRDIIQGEKSKYINNKLSKLSLHKNLQKLNSNGVMMDFDATSLYPSAMSNEKSVYPKIETGFAFRPHMNDVYIESFNFQSFNQDGNASAILKIKYYNPPNLIFQHLPIKKKVEKRIEVNRMRNGYISDTLTSVNFSELSKMGGKVIEIYEGVIYRENFKISPFGKVMENLFSLRK